MKTIIIGGGIAGLSAAICMEELGIDYTIVDKSNQSRNSGMGFILLPNGMKALEELGAADEMRSAGTEIKHVLITNKEGDVIKAQTISDTYCINRSDCQAVLQNKLTNPKIIFNQKFSHFTQNAEGMEKAVFSNGEELNGDLFLGTDGARSNVRKLLFPESKLNPGNVKEIVCLIREPGIGSFMENTFQKVVDTDNKLAMGMAPCNPDEVVWFVQYDYTKYDFCSQESFELQEALLDLFSTWPSLVQRVIRTSDFDNAYHWHTGDMATLPAFHQKNTILIGDAAHLSLTFTSQGANSAMADAVLFSHYLKEVIDGAMSMDDAFEAYYRERVPVLEEYRRAGRELEQQFLNTHALSSPIKIPLTLEP